MLNIWSLMALRGQKVGLRIEEGRGQRFFQNIFDFKPTPPPACFFYPSAPLKGPMLNISVRPLCLNRYFLEATMYKTTFDRIYQCRQSLFGLNIQFSTYFRSVTPLFDPSRPLRALCLTCLLLLLP